MQSPVGQPAKGKRCTHVRWWRTLAVTSVALLAAANAHAQDAACRYVKLATLPVVFNNYRPTVIGAVNQQAAVMLVDTGSYSTMLTMPGVARHELNASAYGRSEKLLGANGESELKYARIESLSIGGVKGARQDMPVIGQMQGGDSIDALVGANFLFQADVELNLAKPEISFFQPLNCDKAFLAYWGGDAYFVDAKRASATDRRPMFTVQINGHDVDAIIDSGASSSVLDIKAAAAAGVSVDSPGVTRIGMSRGIGDNSVPNYLATFDTVTIGAETLRKARLFVSDLNGGYQGNADTALFGPKLLLGADFLKAHRVLFAVSQNRIYISYLGGEVFAGEHFKMPAAPVTTAPKPAVPKPAASPQGPADSSTPALQLHQ